MSQECPIQLVKSLIGAIEEKVSESEIRAALSCVLGAFCLYACKDPDELKSKMGIIQSRKSNFISDKATQSRTVFIAKALSDPLLTDQKFKIELLVGWFRYIALLEKDPTLASTSTREKT
jgi:hypothetical protein